MINFLDQVKNIENDIINWRRELYKIAEVGLDLPKTQSYVISELEKMNIKYTCYSRCSGISAVIGNKEDKKVIALRADMDALPIKEETDCDFACKSDAMHACGHDAHTAMLLGVAKILKENEDALNGRVKLIFQPGEEVGGGAKIMIEEGVLENPKVDALLAQHVAIFRHLKTGTIGIKYDQMMASSDKVFIRVKGRGGHSSAPEDCIDPIVMSTQLINNIYTMIAREISPLDSVTLSVVNIKSEQPEKPAYNIIPNYVDIVTSVRCLDNNMRKYIDKRVEEITKSTVEGMRGSYDYKYNYGYPALINDKSMASLLEKTAKEVLGEKSTIKVPRSVMGSEDAAYYLEKVPGAYYGVVVGDLNKDGYYPAHHPKMKIDESGLVNGAIVLLQTAINYLNENIL